MDGKASNDANIPQNVLTPEAKAEEADFTAVVFHGVSDVYPPDKNIDCCYTIKPTVKPSKRDWVGLFKVGWQSSKEPYTYEWSPCPAVTGEEGKPVHNRVVFTAKYLPKCDEEFYQFCYVTGAGEVRGASVPFQIKTKADETEFEFCDVEEDESMVMVKNRTAIVEDSLARAIEENASFKVSNEKMKGDLERLSDTVMCLEKRKAELTGQVNHERKQNAILTKELDTANKSLAEKSKELDKVGKRITELEASVKDLETSKQELMVIADHANKKIEEYNTIVEKEQTQCSEVQKSRDKLVSEKLHYLQKIAENRELVENLTAEVNKKADEIVTLKEEKENLNLAAAKLKQDLEQTNGVIKDLRDQITAEKDNFLLVKSQAENEGSKNKEEMQTLLKKLEVKNVELKDLKDAVQQLTAKVKLLEKEKDEVMDAALSESVSFENKVKALLEEGMMKDDQIQTLEYEIEDLKNKIELEKGRNVALEEDYEAVLRGMENQLEGEKALNKSLCTQTDTTVSDLQKQLEHQLEVSAEQSKLLEAKTAEAKEALEELEKEKEKVKSLEDRLKVAFDQLSAANEEVKGLKSSKESLQTSLNDAKGKNKNSSKNSAASMYALQTAHTHLEKKYLEAKKKLEEMWKEKNELKRALHAFQSNLPANDWRHEIEEFRAKNEDLRVRLNMGAEAYKYKFIECRRLENQLKKIQKSPSSESPSDSARLMKLQQELEEERSGRADAKRDSEVEKEKCQQIIQELEEKKLELKQLKVNLEKVESEGHLKASSLTKFEEEKAELTSYIQKLETDNTERKNRLAELEEMFQNEKAEKHTLIEEIMNLQEQIKVWEDERAFKDKEIEEIRLSLAQEENERDKLGEDARKKIQELEGTVKKLNDEVDRWKKEVDMHVEAESKLIGSSETPETRDQQQQTPSETRSTIPWPWTRGCHGRMQSPCNQPWVMVPSNSEANPPAINPFFHPGPYTPPSGPLTPPSGPFTPPSGPDAPPSGPDAPPPAPMQSMETHRECPICEILFPPSSTIEQIEEHVNKHLDETDQQR